MAVRPARRLFIFAGHRECLREDGRFFADLARDAGVGYGFPGHTGREREDFIMSKAFEKLEPYMERAMALQTAQVLFEWDNETLAPREAAPYTAKVVGTLSEEYQRIITGGQVRKLLEKCEKAGDLTERERAIVREMKEECGRLASIPPKEYGEFSRLKAEAASVWVRAREKKDFSMFAPTLRRIVEFEKRFAGYRAKKGQRLYDVMLDEYEKGFSMETLDKFFGELKEHLVPLLREITDKCASVEDGFLSGDFPDEAQQRAAKLLAEYVGFNFERGVMALSAHPFTTNLHNHDVRITTHYGRRMDSSMFSVIHEAGHGVYEMGIRDDLTQTPAGQGASMGMHESQSRFFENILGRSEAFWEPIYGEIQEIFPGLSDVPLDKFIRAVNKVKPGLIRTEADELSYCLHIMIRYEIEKMLIEEDLDVDRLPEVWNTKYEEYLGVRPDNDAVGVLQDIHWSQGSIGYFPSYALGSAIGAQLFSHMKKSMDMDALLRQGRISVIREYLRDHVHQYGKMKTTREILMDTTGEDFNPRYYVKYLEEKYRRLFG